MAKHSKDFLRDTLHKLQAMQKYDNKGSANLFARAFIITFL